MAALTPLAASELAKRSSPDAEGDVVVRHDRQGDAGVDRGQLVEDARPAWLPAARACSLAAWITGPSITGSLKGTPISMASAPASATARTTSAQSDPSPPVT